MTEPTTQALADLRRLAVEADQIGMGWTLHSGDKMNVYSTFPFGDDYHIARFFEDVCAAFSVAANPAKVIELLDALEAQGREIERIGRQIISDSDAFVAMREQRDTLRAELAAIRENEAKRAQGAVAMLRTKGTVRAFPMDVGALVEALDLLDEILPPGSTFDTVPLRAVLSTARTQQAPKGGPESTHPAHQNDPLEAA